jgi:glycerol-1-phosphatase
VTGPDEVTRSNEVKTIAQQYDCLLIDLDGTVFRGRQPTDGAVQSLSEVGSRKLFITNNASRSADDVAAHLCELGFTATGADVVTSAQSAAHLLAGQLPAGARVLIVGTEALANEITAVGLAPVRRYDENPVAVVQGLSMTIGWPDLAEAALAIRAGALWVAANVDPTLPTERGLLPGNGSMVAALRAATGVEPQVAGKPAPQLMNDAVARGDFRAPLVVGDRLDTDIEGANAAGLPSLMVLTGVNNARDAVYAEPARRPTYIGNDLRSLHQDGTLLAVAPQSGWQVDVGGGAATVSANGDQQGPGQEDGLSIVRAVASAVWGADRPDSPGPPVRIEAGDERASDALHRWSLVHRE